MEEKERKITPWKIVKWTFLGISILVYAVIFTRIFVSKDAKISDDIILTTDEKSAFEDYEKDYPVYHYQPTAWMNENGSLQIKNINYLEPIKELQFTVRYRISTFETKDKKSPLIFKIRSVAEVDGVEAELVFENLEFHTETRYEHKYIRICCPNITIDDGEKKTYKAQRIDKDGNVTYETVTETVGGTNVYLDVYDAESGEHLYIFSLAGKDVNNSRVRRKKLDVRIID
ncbi:MAG: hypothetical protein E7582_00995 [Ruminococcaceae bacterium]|nr:hypothetical protein [Oscillospiraceae bacterium]